LLKAETGEKVLVKRKSDGVEVDKLYLKNIKPIYEIDPTQIFFTC
jgi:hypothetical protein